MLRLPGLKGTRKEAEASVSLLEFRYVPRGFRRGSGDLANLLETDAFMELPAERTNFEAGEIFRVFPFSRPL